MDAGAFRPDLFYRLAVVQIELPTLAERTEDVPVLARHFLARHASGGRPAAPIGREAVELLMRYTWPGNVRELRNAIEHAATVSGGGPILPAHLPQSVRLGLAPTGGAVRDELIQRYLDAVRAAEGGLYDAAIKPLERALIERALAEAGGTRSEAARRLGLHRNTLRQKLREHGIDPGDAQ
jgi:two-component system nitrogen regulation response regulator GlnG